MSAKKSLSLTTRTLSLPGAVLLTSGFALTAGWADVVCFKTFGSFAALMTGNTVKMGLSVTKSVTGSSEQGADDVLYYISILCSYIFGVWLFNLVKKVWPARPGWAASLVCVALFLMADILDGPTSGSKWRVCLLAPCFGMQNSLSFGGPLAVNTTIITGNMAKVGNALWKMCADRTCIKPLKAIIKPLTAWVATFMGAVAGATVLMKVGDGNTEWMFWPVGVLQLFCFVMHDYLAGARLSQAAAAGCCGYGSGDNGSSPKEKLGVAEKSKGGTAVTITIGHDLMSTDEDAIERPV